MVIVKKLQRIGSRSDFNNLRERLSKGEIVEIVVNEKDRAFDEKDRAFDEKDRAFDEKDRLVYGELKRLDMPDREYEIELSQVRIVNLPIKIVKKEDYAKMLSRLRSATVNSFVVHKDREIITLLRYSPGPDYQRQDVYLVKTREEPD